MSGKPDDRNCPEHAVQLTHSQTVSGIRILLRADLGTAGGTTDGETVTTETQKRLAFANEGILIPVLPDTVDEMKVAGGAARLRNQSLCREQRQ